MSSLPAQQTCSPPYAQPSCHPGVFPESDLPRLSSCTASIFLPSSLMTSRLSLAADSAGTTRLALEKGRELNSTSVPQSYGSQRVLRSGKASYGIT